MSKYVLNFFSSFSGCWVFSNFVIFHYIKVPKHIFEPCCHLLAEICSWFPIIESCHYVDRCCSTLSVRIFVSYCRTLNSLFCLVFFFSFRILSSMIFFSEASDVNEWDSAFFSMLRNHRHLMWNRLMRNHRHTT